MASGHEVGDVGVAPRYGPFLRPFFRLILLLFPTSLPAICCRFFRYLVTEFSTGSSSTAAGASTFRFVFFRPFFRSIWLSILLLFLLVADCVPFFTQFSTSVSFLFPASPFY